MSNRRLELQRLLDKTASAKRVSQKTLNEIRLILLEDPDYAQGFFTSAVSRMMKILSPVVSREDDRPFSLEASVVGIEAKNPMLIFGVSFCPKVGDNLVELEDLLAEEIVGISSLRGFRPFLAAVAVNGSVKFSALP